MDPRTYQREQQAAQEGWRLRQAKLAQQAQEGEAAEAALRAKEALPPARAPEWADDDEEPLTPQGRALREARRTRVTP